VTLAEAVDVLPVVDVREVDAVEVEVRVLVDVLLTDAVIVDAEVLVSGAVAVKVLVAVLDSCVGDACLCSGGGRPAVVSDPP
jgi:hypothetical protein